MLNDLTGKRFGKLSVICRGKDHVQPSGAKQTTWRCVCDCGTVKEIPAYNLKVGKTRSCGCMRSEVGKLNITHGATANNKTERLYSIWSGMRDRCYREKSVSYKNYGAKGITVCDEWRTDFAAFRNWSISNGYADGLMIDRIENSKGYSPDNCRWVTRIFQNNHTSRNRMITAFGKTMTLAQWSRETGINSDVIYQRITNLKWETERALTEPVKSLREKRSARKMLPRMADMEDGEQDEVE